MIFFLVCLTNWLQLCNRIDARCFLVYTVYNIYCTAMQTVYVVWIYCFEHDLACCYCINKFVFSSNTTIMHIIFSRCMFITRHTKCKHLKHGKWRIFYDTITNKCTVCHSTGGFYGMLAEENRKIASMTGTFLQM